MEHENTQTTGVSRRGLVRGATGVAAVGAVAFAAARTPAQADAVAPDAAASELSAQPLGKAAADDAIGTELVVHVRDMRTGDMDVYRGETHMQVQDRDLAERLAAAAL